MTSVKYYTATTVEQLRSSIEERLDWYFRPTDGSMDLKVVAREGVRESRLEMPNLATRLQPSDGQVGEADAKNALQVYDALVELTPQQAADERLWTCLCHLACPEYVTARWLEKRPAKRSGAVRLVRNHFFAKDKRALIRDNGLSRLWWLGFIAHGVKNDDPHTFLTRLLHRQDVRSALIERTSISMNSDVLEAINSVMRDYWERDRSLFERKRFRTWMRNLNRRGGVVLLDALPTEPLASLVQEEATRAMSAP